MRLPKSRNTTRYVRIGFAVLLVFSAAQASWWILDQWLYSGQVQRRTLDLVRQQIAAAASLRADGASDEQITALFPDIEIDGDSIRIAPHVLEQLHEERWRRMNRYFWEGGFFLFVLLSSVGVIGRVLRHDAALRRRQENFLAAVSHELKSPLAGARIAAETLELRDPPAGQRRKQVRRILRNIGRLEAMITNLLDTVRLEEGGVVLDPKPVSLLEALGPVLEAYVDLSAEAGVDFETDIASTLRVRADVQGLRLAVRNLLDNALAAVAGVERPSIVVRAQVQGRFAVLEVCDNGVGFDPRKSKQLFEKFYRPGDEMRRGGRGAGLGLHIVQLVVAASGGRATAHSEGPGRGATFRLSWPLAAEGE